MKICEYLNNLAEMQYLYYADVARFKIRTATIEETAATIPYQQYWHSILSIYRKMKIAGAKYAYLNISLTFIEIYTTQVIAYVGINDIVIKKVKDLTFKRNAWIRFERVKS
ncbi:MAG: hypothetical protein ACPL1B_09700 [Thermoprotei archaeon]